MKKICSDCKKFIKKYKKWNEKQCPKVAIVDVASCQKCKIEYTIYKGMINPTPIYPKASRKELNEMKLQGYKP